MYTNGDVESEGNRNRTCRREFETAICMSKTGIYILEFKFTCRNMRKTCAELELRTRYYGKTESRQNRN